MQIKSPPSQINRFFVASILSIIVILFAILGLNLTDTSKNDQSHAASSKTKNNIHTRNLLQQQQQQEQQYQSQPSMVETEPEAEEKIPFSIRVKEMLKFGQRQSNMKPFGTNSTHFKGKLRPLTSIYNYPILNCDIIRSNIEDMVARGDNPNKVIPFRIFQIGFNKIGTISLQLFFRSNGIPSAHYIVNELPVTINEGLSSNFFQMMNDNKNIPILNGPIYGDHILDEYMYFGDFDIEPQMTSNSDPTKETTASIFPIMDENVGLIWHPYGNIKWFEIFDKQYPNSKFVLNIRSIDNWLKSRISFQFGTWINRFMKGMNKALTIRNRRKIGHKHIYDETMDPKKNDKNDNDKNGKDKLWKWELIPNVETIVNLWKKQWYTYHCTIIEYFYNKGTLNDDLLIFDIEHDNVEKLIKFFDNWIVLDKHYWQRQHSSFEELDLNRTGYPELLQYYIDKSKKLKETNYNELDEILRKCDQFMNFSHVESDDQVQ